jgi:hypothetical protein
MAQPSPLSQCGTVSPKPICWKLLPEWLVSLTPTTNNANSDPNQEQNQGRHQLLAGAD